jgi:hypothetical protein
MTTNTGTGTVLITGLTSELGRTLAPEQHGSCGQAAARAVRGRRRRPGFPRAGGW